MVTGFMAGVALGQQLVGMSKSKKTQTFANTNQRLQSAKIAAYKRMQARQKQFAMVNSQKVLSEMPVTTNQREIFYGKRRGAGKNFRVNTSAEEIVFEEGFAREFKKEFRDDASGQLLNSIRKSFAEFNAWVKEQTGGLLDLNMSLAIFFIIRGIRRIILEKQYPNAWQMIWWASSILRGWRFV